MAIRRWLIHYEYSSRTSGNESRSENCSAHRPPGNLCAEQFLKRYSPWFGRSSNSTKKGSRLNSRTVGATLTTTHHVCESKHTQRESRHDFPKSIVPKVPASATTEFTPHEATEKRANVAKNVDDHLFWKLYYILLSHVL